TLRFSRHQTDREAVGVKMPGMPSARLQHVDYEAGQRIGHRVDRSHGEALRDKSLKYRRNIKTLNNVTGWNLVAGDERVAPGQQDASRVIVRKNPVEADVVHIDRLGTAMGKVRDRVRLCFEIAQGFRPHEAGQDTAAAEGKILPDPRNDGMAIGAVTIGNRVLFEVDDLGQSEGLLHGAASHWTNA